MAEEMTPGRPPLVEPNRCEHLVSESLDRTPSGAQYAQEVLFVEIFNASPGTEVDQQILGILRKHHFQFVEGMAFACTEADKEEARKEVSKFLQSLGYKIPI